ncbi:hypothetical protein FOMPIDRAFT_1013707 [Fomitopsis schrenkii]|uniref:Uncharacterized protein n=1 Tax=Fomitopsis schrenkii TaxID=2126942 RepID=S8EI70_FOMSC|nr:hypothetical protein FOMPIDRAFT_1013707 [Fomitopsis schrenkii]
MATPAMQVPLALLNENVGVMLISATLGAMSLVSRGSQAVKHWYITCKASRILLSSGRLAMNLFHTFLVTDTVYTLSVTHHGNPIAFETLTWSAMAIVIGNVIGDLGVKGRKWYLGALIIFAALVTFAFAAQLTFDAFLRTVVVAEMVRNPTAPPQAVGTYGTLVALASSDILMSVILGVVWYSAETSMITSIGAIVGLILYATFPTKPVLFMAVLWILPYREWSQIPSYV